MTVVWDVPVTDPPGSEDGAASPVSDADDVVMSYLERWSHAIGTIRCPTNDPCSVGLLTAMATAWPDGSV
jgi:hypothetical protein